MTLVTWREEFRVGVPSIDDEHQSLFALINEFHDQYVAGCTRRQLVGVLTMLVAYAEKHFQHEEALMQQHAYPQVERQKSEHEKLYASIYQLNERLARNVMNVDGETLRFLKHWLVDHILNDDLHIGTFLRRQAQEASSGGAQDKKSEQAPAADKPEAATPVV